MRIPEPPRYAAKPVPLAKFEQAAKPRWAVFDTFRQMFGMGAGWIREESAIKEADVLNDLYERFGKPAHLRA